MPGTLDGIVQLLAWSAVGVFNLWIWQKSKALANLLMMLGAFGIALWGLAFIVESVTIFKLARWTTLIGTLAFAYGFFLSIQPQIQAQLDSIKAKAKDATSGDGDGDS